jgi:hypothetical protein
MDHGSISHKHTSRGKANFQFADPPKAKPQRRPLRTELRTTARRGDIARPMPAFWASRGVAESQRAQQGAGAGHQHQHQRAVSSPSLAPKRPATHRRNAHLVAAPPRRRWQDRRKRGGRGAARSYQLLEKNVTKRAAAIAVWTPRFGVGGGPRGAALLSSRPAPVLAVPEPAFIQSGDIPLFMWQDRNPLKPGRACRKSLKCWYI